jgi:hypothetical protein
MQSLYQILLLFLEVVLFRKLFHMLISPSVFPTFSYNSSKISGLWYILSWFLYRARVRDLLSVFYMWISTFFSLTCCKGCFLSHLFLAPVLRIRLLKLPGLNSALLFHWLMSLFLCQYHTIFVSMTLKCSVKSGIVLPSALFILLRIA